MDVLWACTIDVLWLDFSNVFTIKFFPRLSRGGIFYPLYSLLVSFYSLLVALLLVTRCSFTRYSLLFYSLLVSFYSLLVALLLVTRCFFTRYSLRFHSLLVAF